MKKYNKRCKVIIDSLRDYGNGNITGVEIGVFEGYLICTLLDLEPRIKKIYGIDPYSVLANYWRRATQSDWDNLYGQVVNRMSKYGDRVSLIRNWSALALDSIPMVDFVEIDGSHSHRQVMKDINNYEKKVNHEGVICGHDYFGRQSKGVRRAVNEYAEKYGREVHQDESAGMWWWRVP